MDAEDWPYEVLSYEGKWLMSWDCGSGYYYKICLPGVLLDLCDTSGYSLWPLESSRGAWQEGEVRESYKAKCWTILFFCHVQVSSSERMLNVHVSLVVKLGEVLSTSSL